MRLKAKERAPPVGRVGAPLDRAFLGHQPGRDVRRVQAIYQGDVVITSNGREFTISTARTFRTDTNPRRP